jgi:adenosylmethionine-8-amino-7-oxononanoate aminotransferase
VSGRVFRRAASANPPVAVEGHGSTIVDAEGREYLDAAGGAIVVGVGHGRREIADVIAEQAAHLAYVHGSAFTTEPLERYAAEVAPHLPMADPAIYPVSGGSEAIETALKLARATQLARGEPDRLVVFARWGSYHGNTLGALDLSGRRPLRRPYEGWLGRFRHVSAAYPYRGDDAGSQALGTTQALVDELDQAFTTAGPGTVAAFVAEPIVGATLAAVEPPPSYWPAVADVCRRHGALLIADEVMTGFGRTGEWFGLTHYGVQPDLLVAAKGATSGYWPFGFVAASGEVYDEVTSAGPFVHGFTYSHQPTAAAVAREVLRILEAESLVAASATKGDRLRALLHGRLDDSPVVGDVRGRGLMVGVELVRDRDTREPYPRAARLVETVVRIARERGLLLYSGTGNANGIDGDTVLLGPPFVVTDEELVRIADGLAAAIELAVAEVGEAARA